MPAEKKSIDFCLLVDFPSLIEGILTVFGVSRQQVKKYKIAPKKLNKEVKRKQELSLPIDLVNHLEINPLYEGREIVKIYEDLDIIAFSKPIKIHSHPLRYSDVDNVLSYMREIGRSKELLINKGSYDRGLLYRLDYETSGLILYAKKDSHYLNVRRDLKKFILLKKYLAIVDGRCITSGKLTHFLKARGPKDRFVEVYDEFREGSLRVDCHIKVRSYNKKENISLLEIDLSQGHRHQIRKQLEAMGHPICGDSTYNKNIKDPKRNSLLESRMFLHCWKYTVNFREKITLEDQQLGLFKKFFDLNS